MPEVYKRVNAEQLALTKADKKSIIEGQPTMFSGAPVKHDSGRFFVVITHKESYLKIEEGQWLVKHKNGIWEILWPETFQDEFITQISENGRR